MEMALEGDFFRLSEPSFIDLLLPAGFIKLDHEIGLLRLKIRWWIFEEVFAKTGWMCDWQAHIFVQVKEFDLGPIDVG
jgi:hypothetical protein